MTNHPPSQNAAADVQSTAAQLEEIRTLVRTEMPALTDRPAPAVLGSLAPLWSWLAAAQNKSRPTFQHPRQALFLAAHGIHAEKQADLAKLITAYRQPQHPVSALALAANTDLQIYEMDLDVASVNYLEGDAMTETQVLQTLAYGMMAVQPGIDLLAIALPNEVAAFSAAEILSRITAGTDPLVSLTQAGGMDIAAAVGAVIAARLARVPVLLDGPAATAAAAIVNALSQGAADHTRTAADILPAVTRLPPGGNSGLVIGYLKSIAAVV